MSVFRDCMSSVLGARQIFWSIQPPYSSAWKRKKGVSKLEGQNVRKSKAFSEGLPVDDIQKYITYDYIIKTCIYAYIYIYIYSTYSPIDVFLTHSESKMILESSEISLQRIYFFTGEMKHQVFRAFAPQKSRVPLGITRCRRECPVQNFRRRGSKSSSWPSVSQGFCFTPSGVLKIFCFFPTLEMENFWAKTIGCTHWSSRWISGPWSSRRMHPPLQA